VALMSLHGRIAWSVEGSSVLHATPIRRFGTCPVVGWWIGLAVTWLLGPICGSTVTAQDRQTVEADHAQRMRVGMRVFRDQVRPLLLKHCWECHGGKSTKAEFDLSTRKGFLDSGLGDRDAGTRHLLAMLRHEEKPHMPHKRPQLSAAAISAIARWVDHGAPYDAPLGGGPQASNQPNVSGKPQFWSLAPLSVTPPPRLDDQDWPRTAIDRFILQRQQQRGLRPNPAASRRVLIRRAYFDLIGLPPQPEQVQAFVSAKGPQSYEALIDELLESSHYGERWARHWMDVARFAESHGYEQDYDRPHAYHYRDFLITAFNTDMPYDQFVQWQLAGDELAPQQPLALMATGFLGAGAFPTQLTEAEFESARYDELDDMLSTTGVAFLGLSVGCARCHEHKYDPISQRDYYRMAATFTTTIRSEIELQLKPGQKKTKVQVTSEGFKPTKHNADGRGFPHFYKTTHFLNRGDVRQKGAVATPSYLSVLMRNGLDETHWRIEPPEDWKRTSFRRASMARWLTDSQHGAGHVAARVIVNRVWSHHFGRGLVSTPNDFGFQGQRPSHPALLDWLAADLIHHGWKLKRLHKLIMTSAVYLQNTHSDPQRIERDPENRLYWKRVPRRLEAEAIRDSMLQVAGLLDRTLHGPGTLDPNTRRRSVYFFIKRSKLIPMMMLYDWPEHLVSVGQRSRTTVAPQGLMFINSPQIRQYAAGFAGSLRGATDLERIDHAYQVAFGRGASQAERSLSEAFVRQQARNYEQAAVSKPRAQAWTDLCQALLGGTEFIYIE